MLIGSGEAEKCWEQLMGVAGLFLPNTVSTHIQKPVYSQAVYMHSDLAVQADNSLLLVKSVQLLDRLVSTKFQVFISSIQTD